MRNLATRRTALNRNAASCKRGVTFVINFAFHIALCAQPKDQPINMLRHRNHAIDVRFTELTRRSARPGGEDSLTGTLRGRTALITGGAKRIGRETALCLAERGINVVVHFNRSDNAAQELKGELQRKGVSAWTIQADFRQPDEYRALIEQARQIAGGLDILINNASIFPVETIADLNWSSLSANMEVNAWVPFVLSRSFAQQIGRGTIINLHDSRLKGYDWNHTGYILSKHVLAAMTRMIALEFAPAITVNAVAPGLILPPPDGDETYLENLVHTVPLKRHGAPRDIAEAVAFLIQSDFITGNVIYVDGGRHLHEYGDGPHPH